jgi:hypothetical protein
MVELISSGPAGAPVRVLFAHGAGAPMTSPFLESLAELLAARGIAMSRFEFAYMSARRKGGRKPPPRAELLIPEYEAAVAEVRASLDPGQRLVIGGKSLGGRVASMTADGLYGRGAVAGLVVTGYPFHPPGKPGKLRTAHLASLECPALIVQGERDPFGSRVEVEGYGLSKAIRLGWVTDGDHDLKRPRKSPHAGEDPLEQAADAISDFCGRIGGA